MLGRPKGKARKAPDRGQKLQKSASDKGEGIHASKGVKKGEVTPNPIQGRDSSQRVYRGVVSKQATN